MATSQKSPLSSFSGLVDGRPSNVGTNKAFLQLRRIILRHFSGEQNRAKIMRSSAMTHQPQIRRKMMLITSSGIQELYELKELEPSSPISAQPCDLSASLQSKYASDKRPLSALASQTNRSLPQNSQAVAYLKILKQIIITVLLQVVLVSCPRLDLNIA